MTTDQAIEAAAEWECFSDPAYYDMWCVRQIGSRTFGEGFHLVNGDEAEMLCRFLNARDFPAAALMEQGARLALEAVEQALVGYIHPDPDSFPGRLFASAQVRDLDPAEIVKGSGE